MLFIDYTSHYTQTVGPNFHTTGGKNVKIGVQQQKRLKICSEQPSFFSPCRPTRPGITFCQQP